MTAGERDDPEAGRARDDAVAGRSGNDPEAGGDRRDATPDGGVAPPGDVGDERGETLRDPGHGRADGRLRVSRRDALAYAAGTGAGLGGWKALHNVVLGYGVVAGTNIQEQDLASLVEEDLAVRPTAVAVDGYEVRTDGETVAVADDAGVRGAIDLASASAADARALERELGLAGAPVSQLLADVADLRAGNYRFAFSTVEPFVERVAAATPRPFTVAGLRGPAYDPPEPEFVEEFAGVDPADTAALVEGLAAGFREYSYYDVPRYVAGSVEDNVLLGAVDLRQYFESPTSFEALAAGENSGLFCTELVVRSIEAFHAVPATDQSAPVVAGYVQDSRHKHAYTILASVVREGGDLVVPVTFVDYTHSTLYDDLHLRWLLGEGIEAYNDRHRTSGIYWNANAGL